MKFSVRLAATAALALTPVMASAQTTTTLTFESLAVGTTLGSQFASSGVVFTANALTGTGFATNTNLTVVSSTGSDVGGLGSPSLVSGNIIRSFSGWLGENGAPSVRATFSGVSVDRVSITFAGIAAGAAAGTGFRAFDSMGTLLGQVVAPGTTLGQETLTFTALAGQTIASVIILPGTFDDWVGFDNFTFRTVPSAVIPEPSTYVLLATGLVALGGVARKRRAQR